MTVVCVVLNCGPMFEECAEIMKQAGDEFSLKRVTSADEFINLSNNRTERAEGVMDLMGHLQAIGREDFYYPLTDAEFESLDIRLDGHDVVVKLHGNIIYRGKCNIL